LRDVLQLVRSKILARDIHLARNLIVDLRRNADAARFGDAFQTRGDIHPIAVNSDFVVNDIALIDTSPEQHSTRFFDFGIALRHSLLDGNRALDGIHHAAELGEDSVASRVDDTATVVPNDREDYGLVRFEITNGGSLVSAHERALAGDVGSEDRCQFAGNLWISGNIRHPDNQFDYMRPRLA
jgi:hypothetical protein